MGSLPETYPLKVALSCLVRFVLDHYTFLGNCPPTSAPSAH